MQRQDAAGESHSEECPGPRTFPGNHRNNGRGMLNSPLPVECGLEPFSVDVKGKADHIN